LSDEHEEKDDGEYQAGGALSHGGDDSDSDEEREHDGKDEEDSSEKRGRRRSAQKERHQSGKKRACIQNEEDELEEDGEKGAERAPRTLVHTYETLSSFSFDVLFPSQTHRLFMNCVQREKRRRPQDPTKMKESSSKKRTKKMDEHESFLSEMRMKAVSIVSRMNQAAKEDRSNFREEILSFKKMLLLEEVEAIAKKARLHGILVSAGLIGAFAEWLKPLDSAGKEFPSVDTRNRILTLLQWIPMEGEIKDNSGAQEEDLEMFEGVSLTELKNSQIGKVLVLLMNSPEETQENKRMITRLLQRIAAVVAEEEGIEEIEDFFSDDVERQEGIQRMAESEMAKESAKPLIPRTLPSKVRDRIGTGVDLDTLTQVRYVYPSAETFAFSVVPTESAVLQKVGEDFTLKKYRSRIGSVRQAKRGGGSVSGSASGNRRKR
jgi:hypothetical protein